MRKKITIFLLLLAAATSSYTQVLLSETKFELGEINQLNEDVIDLNIVNHSEEAIFILRIEAAKGVAIKYTSKNLTPNAAELVRIKLNPKKTGKIKEEVKLYFSSNQEPTTLEILADVIEIPKDNRQDCPSFGVSERPQANFQQFVNQQQVGEISAFFVELIPEKNFRQWKLAQSKSGEQNEEEKIQAEKVSPQVEVVENQIEKEKTTPEERRNAPSVLETLFGSPKDTAEVVVSSQPKPEVQEAPNQTLNPNTLDNTYKPNNIVFLIDASNSMREEERMDLLKTSMINLLESLREIDYLSIVTYSGEANVLLEPTSGISKKVIRKSIENIKADGGTNAVKGLKQAMQTGKGNFLEDGNNQIILATDGAFNIGERNMSLRRKIETNAEEGLTITVLGIKNDRWTNKYLKEISDLGKGDLIRISGNRDAEKILEEVKKKSKK
ncbi:MAG: VWA domain-containing protein [Vicingaceae bacterium]